MKRKYVDPSPATLHLFPEDFDALALDETDTDAIDVLSDARRDADRKARRRAHPVALIVLGARPETGPASFGLACAAADGRITVHAWHTPTEGRDTMLAYGRWLLGTFAKDWPREGGWRADQTKGPVWEAAKQAADTELAKAEGRTAPVAIATNPASEHDPAQRALAMARMRRAALGTP